jgi:phage baseplate assembly protein W
MTETEELMGVDIALDSSYNIIFNSNNAFNTISGLENLRQAIINRLITPVGTNPFYPLYGSYLHRIVGKGMVSATLIYARQVIYECLLQEPRISTIDEVNCEYVIGVGERFLRIEITVTPIDETNPFNFVYDYFLS